MVTARARTLGEVGERWLATLPDAVAALEEQWDIRVDDVLPGASTGFLAGVESSDGRPAVLKIFLPEGATGAASFRDEMRALEAAGGDPYVDVYRSDAERGAMLLERLGRPLRDLGFTITEQLDVVAQTLCRGWRTAPAGLVNGAEKAVLLREFIVGMWKDLGQPCRVATIARAVSKTQAREDAFEPSSAVLVHGDAHLSNVLEENIGGTSGRFKLIDPEGLSSEPAHDLAIVLRELNEPLLAGDAVPLARGWCEQLADATDVKPEAIWDWAFIERVSTGLLLQHLGDDQQGREYLAAADLLAEDEGLWT
jgi:streptomycin 6-kinase